MTTTATATTMSSSSSAVPTHPQQQKEPQQQQEQNHHVDTCNTNATTTNSLLRQSERERNESQHGQVNVQQRQQQQQSQSHYFSPTSVFAEDDDEEGETAIDELLSLGSIHSGGDPLLVLKQHSPRKNTTVNSHNSDDHTNQHATASTTSSHHDNAHYGVAGLDDDMLSLSPPCWRRAVHMEIQENAKIPTFNLPVDRTGSSHHRSHFHRTTATLHQQRTTTTTTTTMTSTTGADHHHQQHHHSSAQQQANGTTNGHHHRSLTEFFLQSPHRASFHANYATKAALPQQQQQQQLSTANNNSTASTTMTTTNNSGLSCSSAAATATTTQDDATVTSSHNIANSDTTDVFDSLLASIDPTPLSEIRERSSTWRYIRPEPLPIPTERVSPPTTTNDDNTNNSTTTTTQHNNNNTTTNKNSYSNPNTDTASKNGITTPVASNNNKSTPGNAQTMADAVATAAAIACQTPWLSVNSKSKNNAANQQQQPAATATIQQQTVTANGTTNSTSTLPHLSSPASAPAPSSSSTWKVVVPGAIKYASQNRSQFGFGTQHKVVSVPKPPKPLAKQQTPTQVQPHLQLNNNNNNTTVTTNNVAAGAATTISTSEGVAASTNGVATSANTAASGRASVTMSSSVGSGRASHTPSPTNQQHPQNHGAAYERKKQRAKDARVKLNESIERLAIAITVAGTQSKTRASQWESIPIPSIHNSNNNNNSTTTSANTKQQADYRQAGLQLMRDCTKTAESAKKWDRPSFVGSAAALVQGLNGQCEALVRELITCNNIIKTLREQLQQQAQAQNNNTATTVLQQQQEQQQEQQQQQQQQDVNNKKRSAQEGPEAIPKEISIQQREKQQQEPMQQQENHQEQQQQSSHKRPRVGPMADGVVHEGVSANKTVVTVCTESGTTLSDRTATLGSPKESWMIHLLEHHSKMMERIASFLDPVSLLRCVATCRPFKSSGVFVTDDIWQQLAARRFGYINARQWRGRLEQECDEMITVMQDGITDAASSPSTAAARATGTPNPLPQPPRISSLQLYKTMDAANVQPHTLKQHHHMYQHPRNQPHTQGLILLGEARLQGQVSAWTFLVERSNGETLRSVRRQSWMPGMGVYASLPVVELRTILQNTGLHDQPVVLRKQLQTVDASTRRRSDEMKEIDWDDRFRKRVLNLDGSVYLPPERPYALSRSLANAKESDLCALQLYQTVVVETYVHARGCSTTSKFIQRSNFTQFLVQIRNGTTVPLVIPFPRDAVTPTPPLAF